jgi:hypothetical protein
MAGLYMAMIDGEAGDRLGAGAGEKIVEAHRLSLPWLWAGAAR